MVRMRTTHSHGHITWVDLENPTSEEIRTLIEERGIPSLVAEELLSPTLKPKVDLYPSCIYLILHFPAFRHTHRRSSSQEIDFVVGKDFLITTRYDTVDPLHKFSKVFEVNSILDRSDIGTHAGFVLFYMLRKLYRAVEHELEYLADELRVIEGRIFSGQEKAMVFELSRVQRTLLSFRQALRPHEEILESLERAGERFFGEEFRFHLKGISGEYFRVHNNIRALADSLQELRETNNSLLSTKQNEIMKVLTVVAFITLPLSLLLALFQIDAVARPIVGLENDFWIIVGIMAGVGLPLLIFFKFKKWL